MFPLGLGKLGDRLVVFVCVEGQRNRVGRKIWTRIPITVPMNSKSRLGERFSSLLGVEFVVFCPRFGVNAAFLANFLADFFTGLVIVRKNARRRQIV